MANFDDILRHLGEFGRYQKWVYFLLCLPAIPHGVRMMINVYILNVPDHRCAIPGYPNDTYAVQSPYHAKLINETIPFVQRNGKLQYDQCRLYINPNDQPKHSNTTVECGRWVYDQSVFIDTAATEFNMVCAHALEASNAQVLFMAGYLVGAFLFGAVGDRFGRRKALFLCIVVLFVGGLALNWAPSYLVFVIIRFINGATTAGMYTTCFVIGMEFVGPSKRMWAGIISGFFFTIGYVIVASVAFVIRDWHTLELVMASPVAVFLVYWWVIPESPRWLLNEARVLEAEIIIRHAARVNGVTIPESSLSFEKEDLDPKKKLTKATIFQLFTSRVLFFRTSVIFFSWMVVSLAYFGLSANADNLGAGSLRVNSLLAGLVEFPASIICLLLLNRIGRKALLCVFMVLGGLSCILTIVTISYAPQDEQWTTIALSMVGKLCSSGAFSVVYVYSSEIFPTSVRNSALGLCSSMARVGGMIAPYFLEMGREQGGKLGIALPMVAFGVLALLSGLSCLLLPETLGRDLPETIEDAEKFGRTKRPHILEGEDEYDQHTDDQSRPLLPST